MIAKKIAITTTMPISANQIVSHHEDKLPPAALCCDIIAQGMKSRGDLDPDAPPTSQRKSFDHGLHGSQRINHRATKRWDHTWRPSTLFGDKQHPGALK